MSLSFDRLVACLASGIQFLPATLALTAIAILTGLLVGGAMALFRTYRVPVLSQISAVFVTMYSGIPVMVALVILNLLYLTQFDNVAAALGWNITVRDVSPFWVAAVAVTLTATVYVSEAVRGSVLSVDTTQYEAAYSVGLTKWQTIRRIVIPQFIPVFIPMLCTNIIGTMKSTSIVMTVGVMELLNGSLLPSMKNYSFLEGYIAAALVYWAISILIEAISRYAEKRTGEFRAVAQ
ncbi:L-cystine transport system permease protein tcyL [Slackia heliotrinireducens]|uniref:Amino acid ABC transporter membrane protein n=1 Tax=Slackia heliotrinireducens (strain ATCC 29202 / DSM 20476 / NCTC 11029 / RHS 1) TaxID=471855 RepID=C7N2B9_SLAHD|nr:amino acid ABC transporter permease [Slackia heliotrinireducens]ACV21425.1 amino acid ABC transporter membrane protein [Slackia heliotrinireducens DSM 20476]VEG98862.1 L-cystine transport system permease protein tcyL [Slackia heliotrinireducens]